MNYRYRGFCCALLVLPAFNAYADSHEDAAVYYPVEAFTCNYNERKDSEDLERVIADWSEFLDERDVDTYFAMTMVPHYYGSETFDFGWVGSWASGEAMGEGTDMWLAEGGALIERFADVADCNTHANFASSELKAPPSESPPDSVVVTFSDCTLRDDSTMDEAYEGMAAFADYQAEAGMAGGTWIWWPVYGGGDADFDFKIVEGFPDHATLGRLYDWYGNGGAYSKWEELVGAHMTCDDGRVYNGTVRRRMAVE